MEANFKMLKYVTMRHSLFLISNKKQQITPLVLPTYHKTFIIDLGTVVE